MRRFVVTALTVVLLWALLGQANHVLSGLHVFVFLGSLFIAHAALTFEASDSLAIAVFTGLLSDTQSPVPFGLHTLLFVATHLLLMRLRDRLPREELVGRVVIALFVNLALFLVLSFIHIGDAPAPGSAWLRLFCDLLVSQIALALIAPWFFSLQERSLEFAGVMPSRRL